MNNSVPTAPVCERCGVLLAPGALQGLCPRCLMEFNLATETKVTGDKAGRGDPQAANAPPLAPAEVALHLPHLEVLACLGRGGMGVVYKARQARLNRLVALKILAPEKEGAIPFAARFQQEAQALARLSHPNIVAVYEFGETDGFYYLVMEYVDGVSLRQLLQARKLTPEQALAIVPKICEALQYAHNQGIVHRDIKPENILLERQGVVKIADFGIAKIVGGERAQAALTEEKQVIGTPHYMAPEQVEQPQLVDHRADIYSLGVVFYEMLTGELPLGKFPLPSRKAAVDPRLDEVVLHALEKEPARRYQNASEVKADVETIAVQGTAASQSGLISSQTNPGRLGTSDFRRVGLALQGCFAVLPRWAWLICLSFALLAASVLVSLKLFRKNAPAISPPLAQREEKVPEPGPTNTVLPQTQGTQPLERGHKTGLTNGVQVEVVAIEHGRENRWFTPFGLPLARAPVEVFPSEEQRAIHLRGGDEFLVYVRWWPPKSTEHWQSRMRFLPEPDEPPTPRAVQDLEYGWKGVADRLRYVLPPMVISCQVAAAVGPWDPVATWTSLGSELQLAAPPNDGHGPVLAGRRPLDFEQFAWRLAASFGKERSRYAAISSAAPHLSQPWTAHFAEAFPPLPVQQYSIERAPWVWGRIPSYVSLQNQFIQTMVKPGVPTFHPEIKQVVLPLEGPTNRLPFLSLKTGRILTPPPEVNPGDRQALAVWAARNDLQLTIEPQSEGLRLIGHGCGFLEITLERCHAITPLEVMADLQKASLVEAVALKPSSLPTPFLFHTQKGDMGLLVIAGYGADGRSVKVRCRLLHFFRQRGN